VLSDVREAGDMTDAIGINLAGCKHKHYPDVWKDSPTTECHECRQFTILPHLAVNKELGRVFWSGKKAINAFYGHSLATERSPDTLPVTHNRSSYEGTFDEEGHSGAPSNFLQLIVCWLSIQMGVKEVMTYGSSDSSNEHRPNQSRRRPMYMPLCYLPRSPVY
jgi:hypothetical protein